MTTEEMNAFKIIKYKEWEFEVDIGFTRNMYSKFPSGGANECECKDCENFAMNRDNVYPDEIKELFAKIGIDYHKESEVCHYVQLENGLHFYGGWFHFKGKILTGDDCRIFHSPETSTFNLTNITENFRIGFTRGNSPSLFESLDGLIQVEFETNIPWIINGEHSQSENEKN